VTIFPDGGERYLSDAFWTRPDDEDGARVIVPRPILDAIRSTARRPFPTSAVVP